jgi:hypothetical protein
MSGKYRYLNYGLIILVLFLTVVPNAAAESAKEQLQGTIDRAIEILRTIQSQEDIERNRNSLRQILLTRFDFAAMAQKSLGNRWNDLKGKEEEFVSAFTDFVEHSYMSTLGSYRGEKVVYDRDRANGEFAEVDTRLLAATWTRWAQAGEPIRNYRDMSKAILKAAKRPCRASVGIILPDRMPAKVISAGGKIMAIIIMNQPAALAIAYCLTGLSLWTINSADMAQLTQRIIGAVQRATVKEQAPVDRVENHVKPVALRSVQLASPVGQFRTLAILRQWQLGSGTGTSSSKDMQPVAGKLAETLESSRVAAMVLVVFALAENSTRRIR